MKGDTLKYVNFVDSTANDSDKTIDLSEVGNFDCQLVSMHVDYTTTSTAGNRLLEIDYKDADGVSLGHIHPGSYQAASLVYHYYFMLGIYRETVSAVADSGIDGTIQVPIPNGLILPRGGSIVIKDGYARDPAADDMIIRGQLRVLR